MAHPRAQATMLAITANQMGWFLTHVNALDVLLRMRGSVA